MANMLEQASEWLEDQRVKHTTCTVVYQRSDEAVEVQATIGRTVFEQADGYGVIVRHEARDFLILADDLVLGGQARRKNRRGCVRMATYRPRPFIGPAFEKEKPKLLAMWADSVR